MCIACWLPGGTVLSDEEFYACWENNNYGGGLAYVDDEGAIVVKKSLNYAEFLQMYFSTTYGPAHGKEMMVHFRIGTSGEPSIINVHPFEVNDSLVFCHNGIISEYSGYDHELSDTQLFNIDVLRKLPGKFYLNSAYISLLNSFCSGSKLLFMDSIGRHAIVNERMGTWNKGRWFSNTSYTSPRKYGSWKDRKSTTNHSGAAFGDYDEDDMGIYAGYSAYGYSGTPKPTTPAKAKENTGTITDAELDEMLAENEDKIMQDLQDEADHVTSSRIFHNSGMVSKRTVKGKIIPICAVCDSVFTREESGSGIAICGSCRDEFILSNEVDVFSSQFKDLPEGLSKMLVEEACEVWEANGSSIMQGFIEDQEDNEDEMEATAVEGEESSNA